MVDNLSAEDRIKTMRAVKGSQTAPERRIRAILAANGINGWKLNVSNLPGRPDIVFEQQQVAIFIHGCFWHKCPVCKRPMPKNNSSYWKEKIIRNVKRDIENKDALEDLGWHVLIFWEHELRDRDNCKMALTKIKRLVS